MSQTITQTHQQTVSGNFEAGTFALRTECGQAQQDLQRIFAPYRSLQDPLSIKIIGKWGPRIVDIDLSKEDATSNEHFRKDLKTFIEKLKTKYLVNRFDKTLIQEPVLDKEKKTWEKWMWEVVHPQEEEASNLTPHFFAKEMLFWVQGLDQAKSTPTETGRLVALNGMIPKEAMRAVLQSLIESDSVEQLKKVNKQIKQKTKQSRIATELRREKLLEMKNAAQQEGVLLLSQLMEVLHRLDATYQNIVKEHLGKVWDELQAANEKVKDAEKKCTAQEEIIQKIQAQDVVNLAKAIVREKERSEQQAELQDLERQHKMQLQGQIEDLLLKLQNMLSKQESAEKQIRYLQAETEELRAISQQNMQKYHDLQSRAGSGSSSSCCFM